MPEKIPHFRSRGFVCPNCGQRHATRNEENRCRNPKVEKEKGVATPRAATNRYDLDPLKGDKQAHAIAKKLRGGMAPRKVAKLLGVPLDRVEAVREKLPKK